MVVISAAAVVLLVGPAGCGVGELNGMVGADAGGDAEARAAFESDVQPLLDGFCAACHTAMPGIEFLKPEPDVRSTMLGWPGLVSLPSPSASKLLTKGAHEGPAWTAEQAEVILDWVKLEGIAAGVTEEVVETPAFAPVVGVNTVDLAPVGLTGSTLTFRLEQLSVGMYLSEIMVNAGPGGAHLVHPLFVTWTDGVASPDPVDRFAGLELTVEESTAAMLGGGTLVMVDVPAGSELSIHFAKAEPAVGGGGGGLPGGCKDVASFTANARAPLEANCASCHAGGDAAATAATDMSLIADLTAEGQAAVCAQILSRVNVADPVNSGIFIAPDPNSGAGHPFKFGGDVNAFNGFRDALLLWIAQEQAQ